MGARWRAAAVFVALGLALPAVARADGGQISQAAPGPAYTATPFLPDQGTFDALLMDIGRPPGTTPHGMSASNVSLAVRANSPVLLPDKPQTSDLNLMTNPALNAPLVDVPAGQSVFDLLAPDSSGAKGLKVKDVGKLVIAHDGPLQRTERAFVGPSPFRDVALTTIGAALSAGLIARLGTARAQAFGINPATSFHLLGDTLTQSVAFHCDAKMKNAGVDLAERYHLLHVDAPHIAPWLKDAFLEGGVTAARNTGSGVLPNKYLRLRFSNDFLETMVQAWKPPTTPLQWDLENVAHLGLYRLHTNFSRETQTGALGIGAAFMRAFPAAQLGTYVGAHTGQGLSTGVLAMLVF